MFIIVYKMLSKALLLSRHLSTYTLSVSLSTLETRRYCSNSRYSYDEETVNYGDYVSGILGCIVLIGVGGFLYVTMQCEYTTTRKQYKSNDYNKILEIAKERSNISQLDKIKEIRGETSYNGQTKLVNIDKKYWTEQFIIDMINGDKGDIKDVPEEFYSQKLFDSLNIYTYSLKDVPKEYQTKELCEKKLKESYGEMMKYIKHPYTDIFWRAIKKNPSNIQFVAEEFQTEDMWQYVITNNPSMIHIHPKPSYYLWFLAYSKDATITKQIKDPKIKNMLKNVRVNTLDQIVNKEIDADIYVSKML